MSSLVVAGDTSGSITLQAPSVAGSTTLTLPSTSGTVVIGTTPSGTIVGTTDTQTLTNKTLTSPTITGASVSSMASSVITSGTAVASTSGTSIDFTGIPAWAKRITVMFNGVSTSGTSNIHIQLGSGTIQTTGYLTAGTNLSTTANSLNDTAGFPIGQLSAATSLLGGNYIFNLLGSNIWSGNGMFGQSDSAGTRIGAGSVTLSSTLDRVRITTVNGTDTFDAGSINIMYE